MENWGLVTYRTTAILFDEKQSDAKYKNKVAYVVAHGIHASLGYIILTVSRARPSMVRESRDDGLVECLVA